MVTAIVTLPTTMPIIFIRRSDLVSARAAFSSMRKKSFKSFMCKMLFLIYRYQDTLVRLDVAPNGFIHSFGFVSGNPYLMALFAGLNTNIFKEIEFLFHEAVNGGFSITEFPSADGTQVVFHFCFSLLVFGSSHFAGSNQWTVII